MYTAMNKKLTDAGGKAKLDSLDRAGKQAWLAKYKLESSLSWCEAYNKAEVSRMAKPMATRMVLTESQLGGPAYLNNPDHAKWIREAKILPEASHSSAALRDTRGSCSTSGTRAGRASRTR